MPPCRLIALLLFCNCWTVWSMLMLWSLLAKSLSSWFLQFLLTPSWWLTDCKVLVIFAWQALMQSTSLISEFSTTSPTRSISFLPSLKVSSVIFLSSFSCQYHLWWIFSELTLMGPSVSAKAFSRFFLVFSSLCVKFTFNSSSFCSSDLQWV